MASTEAEEGGLEGSPSPSSTDPGLPDTGGGVTVLITSCALEPLVAESEDSLQPFSTKTVFMNRFATKKGLSTASLDVLTSGEHLDELSLEDLSDGGSEQDKEGSTGSIPDCQSLEGEVGLEDCRGKAMGGGEEGLVMRGGEKEEGVIPDGEEQGLVQGSGANTSVGAVTGQGKCPGEVLGLERQPDQPEKCPDELGRPNPPKTAVEVTCQTPSDESRCSSSMGYLEPRPSNQSPPDNGHLPSPKDIQRHLMERVCNLSPGDDTEVVQGAAVQEAEAVGASTIHSSRSSQSLNSSGRSSKGISFGSIFKRRSSLARSRDHNPETMAATSTTGLILHDRPKTLPAKSPAEENRHQRLHQQMMVAARKKELQKAKQEVKKEKRRRERDKLVADSLVEWERILLKWESLHNTRKVRELWWQGLPPGVRGNVWKKAIGNDLHISSDLYAINLRRCKERLALARERSDSTASRSSVSREQSVEVIHLDVIRTFPTLGFFQEGGPYNQSLCDVLGAYACYRPDIGYVQGMSFLAGVLLLNMDAGDAFISLANLLNRPSYLAFFKVDHTLMQPYFSTFAVLLHDNLPKLSTHFFTLQFSPEYYLIEWIFTIYTRVLPLDVACRVWDMFCRDGDSFLFKTALGILKMFQSSLLEFRSIEDMGQFLGNLPDSLDSDVLFSQIDSIRSSPKRFRQILLQEHSRQHVSVR